MADATFCTHHGTHHCPHRHDSAGPKYIEFRIGDIVRERSSVDGAPEVLHTGGRVTKVDYESYFPVHVEWPDGVSCHRIEALAKDNEDVRKVNP